MTRRGWEAARPYVLAPLFVGLLLLLSGRRSGWIGLLGAAGMLAFFRDPKREIKREPEILYAAADGLVREVDEVVKLLPSLPSGLLQLKGAVNLSLYSLLAHRCRPRR